MKHNFIKRIQRLLESSSNLRVQESCRNTLEYFKSVVNENTNLQRIQELELGLGKKLLSELKHINESEVQKFCLIEERFQKLHDMGISKLVKELSENIELAYTFGNLPYQISNLAKTNPDFMIAEQVLNILKPYTFNRILSCHYSEILESVSKLKEDIDISKVLYEIRNSQSFCVHEPLLEKVEEYMIFRERTKKVEALNEMTFFKSDPQISKLYSILNESSNVVDLENPMGAYDIRKITSPIIYKGKSQIFYTGESFAQMDSNKNVIALRDESVISPEFHEMCKFLNSPNVLVESNAIKVFTKNSKIILKEDVNFGKLKIFVNDEIMEAETFGYSVDIFDQESTYVTAQVLNLCENWETIFDVDNGMKIVSKLDESKRANIFKSDSGSFTVNLVDLSLGESEFHVGLNALKSKNLLSKFFGDDMSELQIFGEQLSENEQQIAEYKKVKENYLRKIEEYNSKIAKLESFDDYVKEQEEYGEILDILKGEIRLLQKEVTYLNEKIKSLSVNEGFFANPGDTVIYQGQTGKILSVSNIDSTCIVQFPEGKIRNLKFKDVSVSKRAYEPKEFNDLSINNSEGGVTVKIK